MSSARISLARPLPGELAGELEKRLFFISSEIDAFTLVRSGNAVCGVDLVVSSPGAPDEPAGGVPDLIRSLQDKINHVVETEIRAQKAVPAKVLWRSAGTCPGPTDVFGALVSRGIAFESGEGQVGLGEPLISLMDYLDRRLRAIAMDLGDAEEYQYPTLLPTSVLDRFGYFGSFPQYVMFVTRLHNDIDVYRAFSRACQAEGKLPSDVLARCQGSDYCLPPTMCYHSYQQHQGRELAHNKVVTARGKSFRFESKYYSGLRRLWDFTIREIVFMGTPEFVLECRGTVLAQTVRLMEELGISGTCELANDHFFAAADTVQKMFSQRLMELKYELLLKLTPDTSTAAGSFNIHGQFFGESFGISWPGGGAISTGCAGFGLERLAYAFVCQHGIEPAGWPVAVRREMS